MCEYLAVYKNDSRVIESFAENPSFKYSTIKEDESLKTHLPFLVDENLSKNVLFIRVEDSHLNSQELGKFINNLFEMDHDPTMIIRINELDKTFTASYRKEQGPIEVIDLDKGYDEALLKLLEKTGPFDIESMDTLRGVKYDELKNIDKALLANGLPSENIYESTETIHVENVKHLLTTKGRLQVKEEHSNLKAVLKPVYQEIEIPKILQDHDPEELNKFLIQEIDHIQVDLHDHHLFFFVDKERNKILSKKDDQILKEFKFKPENKPQEQLLLQLSTQERKTLAKLHTVNVNKEIKDQDGNTVHVSATLQPRINFIRKELSFKMKTIKESQDVKKKFSI